MSVRAYITEQISNKIEERNGESKRVIEYEENIEPLFNVWHNDKIFDIIRLYGGDFTNSDCVGIIEISQEQWDYYKTDYKIDKDLLQTTNEEKEILAKIDYYLKENEVLTLNCY